ncbi:Opi10 protein [Martiniozyma asiatica (nom. inval.)]|nr:Opi10 protein [Martiniozyma asiatica]
MFGSTVSNRPVMISQAISPQKQMIEFNDVPLKQIYHLSIFMLPNVQFDPDYTALIFYQIQSNLKNVDNLSLTTNNEFKLLGCLDAQKQSAIFKLNPGKSIIERASLQEGDIDMDMDMDMVGDNNGSNIYNNHNKESVNIIIGISIEKNEIAMGQLDILRTNRDAKALIKPDVNVKPVNISQNQIFEVSNKIIGNAYNFLSSFSDMNGKVELRKFNDWWDKFKIKMQRDPDYLKKLE